MSEIEIRERVAARLREWRGECGMSLDQAAEMVGVSKDNLEGFENGSQAVPVDVLHALSIAYDVDPQRVLMTVSFAMDSAGNHSFDDHD